ncbi:hypothetical protein [Acidiphilium acidophilum]|uniref:hypothetical protein n=1 Tax=Acidiphilium acidophilum TaxID=76588 RepID=UPI002E8E6A37|nr:hypothetical protein [Acidiphilium acidophilum]
MPLLLRALWNQRIAALFIVGPGVSVSLVALIFGLAHDLQLMAVGMFVLTVGLFSILLSGEYRNLRHHQPRR